jgi:hypothetical protein
LNLKVIFHLKKTFNLRFKEATECPSFPIEILSKHFKKAEEASKRDLGEE